MIYDYTDPALHGRRFRVFDANGLEWSHVTRCDAETGEITRNKLLQGCMYADPTTHEIARETIKVAAPLLVVEVTR